MAFIEKVYLNNFRNFEEIDIQFSKSVNVIIGQNGQGKTNIIESIILLMRGQSFRPGKIHDFINKKSQTAYSFIQIKIIENDLSDDIKLKLLESKKSFQINEKSISSSQLKKRYSVVLFSPESLSSIKSGPEQRRLLVDELLVTKNPQNNDLINKFKKSLKARNKLLKEIKACESDPKELHGHLNSLNELYLPLAVELIEKRLEALQDIQNEYAKAMKDISGDKNVDISVDYIISDQVANLWSSEQIYNALAQRMKELQAAECAIGLSLVGPHKNDIQFLYQGQNSRFFCSQGQQRALILSFKMAQIKYHYTIHKEYPILFLDDVMSELDESKRQNLISFLKEIDSQIFLTTTEFSDSSNFNSSELEIFEIEKGCLKSH